MNTAVDTTRGAANGNTETYVGVAEAAKLIRDGLKKELGWNRKMVSVRAESFSMGSAIRIKILSPLIPLAKVKKVASRFEHVRHDERTGEILSGGNRYLDVEYDVEMLARVSAPILEKLTIGDGEFVSICGYDVTRQDRDTYLATKPGECHFSVRCYGRESCARQIATQLLEAGIDPSTGFPFVPGEKR